MSESTTPAPAVGWKRGVREFLAEDPACPEDPLTGARRPGWYYLDQHGQWQGPVDDGGRRATVESTTDDREAG